MSEGASLVVATAGSAPSLMPNLSFKGGVQGPGPWRVKGGALAFLPSPLSMQGPSRAGGGVGMVGWETGRVGWFGV